MRQPTSKQRKNNIVNIQQFVLLSVIISVRLLKKTPFRSSRRTYLLERLTKGGNFICKSEKSLSNDPLLFSNISFHGKYKSGFTNAARITIKKKIERITQLVIGIMEKRFRTLFMAVSQQIGPKVLLNYMYCLTEG